MLSILISAVLLAISPGSISRLAELPPKEPAVTLMAVGDVLLDRGIARRIKAHGRGWAFAKVSPAIRSADIALCNLECPLSLKGVKVNKPYCFKANPAYVQCLVDSGFDMVSLANNHSLDCGRTGLLETMSYLDKAGIRQVGAGKTLSEANHPVVMDIKGLKVAFLARNMLFPEGAWFRPDAPGVALLESSSIEDEVARAHEQADVVVVILHWGTEYRKQPKSSQKELARKLIDAGADLVIGHHPHVVQPVEKYHGGVIAYSIGNFLFDSTNPMCKDSMILKCRLSKSGVSDIELIPVRIEDWRPVMKSGNLVGGARS